jgi:hypothetical protein
MKEIVTIQKSLQHRSFNPQSESHQNLKVICKIKSAKSPLAIHIWNFNYDKRLFIFFGLVGTIVLLFKFCDFKKSDDATTIDGAGLIQQQILNVGKLIVTEGHFSSDHV